MTIRISEKAPEALPQPQVVSGDSPASPHPLAEPTDAILSARLNQITEAAQMLQSLNINVPKQWVGQFQQWRTIAYYPGKTPLAQKDLYSGYSERAKTELGIDVNKSTPTKYEELSSSEKENIQETMAKLDRKAILKTFQETVVSSLEETHEELGQIKNNVALPIQVIVFYGAHWTNSSGFLEYAKKSYPEEKYLKSEDLKFLDQEYSQLKNQFRADTQQLLKLTEYALNNYSLSPEEKEDLQVIAKNLEKAEEALAKPFSLEAAAPKTPKDTNAI